LEKEEKGGRDLECNTATRTHELVKITITLSTTCLIKSHDLLLPHARIFTVADTRMSSGFVAGALRTTADISHSLTFSHKPMWSWFE
jgi:hypothetical protein